MTESKESLLPSNKNFYLAEDGLIKDKLTNEEVFSKPY